MKIAMYNLTTTSRFGGVETFVWEISRELARRGAEVHIIGGRGTIERSLPGVQTILFPFWPRERIPNFGSRFRKLVERWSFGLRAVPRMVKEKYDIFHIHKPYDLPIGLWIKKRTGARLILGCHGTDFFPADRIFSRDLDGIVSCSQFNASQIASRFGKIPEVIYNGIDPEIFRPLPYDTEIARRLALEPGKTKNIMYAGRLVGLKGVQDLLWAAAKVKKEFPIRVLIAGEGEARPRLESLSGSLGIADRVIFTGFIPHRELPRYYSLIDLAVFPSVADETFGLAICEAMACGKAIVATRVGGIPELVQEEETGLLAKPKDPDELACRISLLLGNDEVRRRMGEKGAQRVRALFSWEAVADRLARVYQKVLTPEGMERKRSEQRGDRGKAS